MIDPDMPLTHYLKLASEMRRLHASLIVQLCTGHVPLNKYLCRIGKADSAVQALQSEQRNGAPLFV